MSDGFYGLDLELGWQKDAACRNTGRSSVMQRALADRYFADHAATVDVVRACKACPVREQCLAWALENNELGYWGGLSETERRRMKTRGAA
jgi:WhiB family redox-sensing transcriptional regulator